MSTSPAGRNRSAIPPILVIGFLLGASIVLPTILNISWLPSSAPQKESDISATVTRTAESYGLTLCESIPVEISYPGVVSAVLTIYGLACGAYSTGSILEVLIVSFHSQDTMQAAAGSLKMQLAKPQATGIVLVETGDSLIILRGPASQSIPNRIL
jgi:hypothetical protein